MNHKEQKKKNKRLSGSLCFFFQANQPNKQQKESPASFLLVVRTKEKKKKPLSLFSLPLVEKPNSSNATFSPSFPGGPSFFFTKNFCQPCCSFSSPFPSPSAHLEPLSLVATYSRKPTSNEHDGGLE